MGCLCKSFLTRRILFQLCVCPLLIQPEVLLPGCCSGSARSVCPLLRKITSFVSSVKGVRIADWILEMEIFNWHLCCTFTPSLTAWPTLRTDSPMSLYPHWISCTWFIHLPLRWSRKFLWNGSTLTNYTVTYTGMAHPAALPEIARKIKLNIWIKIFCQEIKEYE